MGVTGIDRRRAPHRGQRHAGAVGTPGARTSEQSTHASCARPVELHRRRLRADLREGAPGRRPRARRRRRPGRLLRARDDRLPAARPAPPRELRRREPRPAHAHRRARPTTASASWSAARPRTPPATATRSSTPRRSATAGRWWAGTTRRCCRTYDVFDEDRYFEPGSPREPFDFKGSAPRAHRLRGGLERPRLLAEAPLPRATRYPSSPTAAPTILLNISSSPVHDRQGRRSAAR